MTKIRSIVVAIAGLFVFASASAQKTGYISIDQVVGLMPEVTHLDSSLQRFQADSLNPQYAYMISEYQRKDGQVNGKDSASTPVAVRRQIRQELEQMAYQIQNWQTYVQTTMQSKQEELLEPLYRKAANALNAVSKENGYSYIFKREALLVMPPGDDLLPLVAKKLNLRVPAARTGNEVAPTGTEKTKTKVKTKP